jgi:acyl transferase domain-containing protein/NADPH:quinone reductase-like Zn-dependent oxidoreductase/acyl carrier protein
LITVPDAPLGILGLATRLPGAPDIDALWSVLDEQRSTVTDRPPPDRWHPERFLNPNPRVRGATYTFAGGYLRDAHHFDAQAFGLSPREAAQMDPQQRLMLEVVWEALEDAGIPPSSLAGRAVGVYVGASATDYADVPLLDVASIEAHFMTGNSLSIISNRVSYVFDLKGPSLTLDTACSSSVVALAEATMALEAGKIELAIVGGVNVLSSPAPFIGFSRAGMLSPTGRSRPFSAAADGYVRSEGAVALVLGKMSETRRYARPRALLRAIGVNSDGRTNGINMPSIEGQRTLLDAVYDRAGIAPSSVDFVEAHGTGTKVGDPVEARAIGGALGRGRNAPLPVGSVKSNIGHLEAASGLAGLAKCVLAMEHRRLPASLYLDQLNPLIPVEELGLAPAAQPVPLAPAGRLRAGLCNYGFGGTNAHAVLESADEPVTLAKEAGAEVLLVSAHTREALQALAGDYAQALRESDALTLAAEADATRDRLRHRLVVDLRKRGDAAAELEAFHRTGRPASPQGAIQGEAVAPRARVAFVFSGNGSQWPGMGRAAYRGNARFREAFDDIAARVRAAGGTCPLETMEAADSAERLRLTTAAQPVIFATQMALVAALEAEGLRPEAVLGHSVGEVAAATAAGALSLDDGVRLIVRRSAQQEFARDLGRMAVLACDGRRATQLLEEAGAGQVEIAALNGPGSTTVSGTQEGVAAVVAAARRHRLAAVQLDIEYPFHSALLDPAREPLVAALHGLAPRAAELPLFSTVTGALADGTTLGPAYWWSNIREPVLFQSALEGALAQAELVIEIGPRPILGGAIAEVARAANRRVAVMASLTQDAPAPGSDPVRRIALEALARGAAPGPRRPPPASPRRGPRRAPRMRWNRASHRIEPTNEAYGIYGIAQEPVHPLLGARIAQGGAEWRHLIGTDILPFLAGHRVDGEVVFPATGYIEMIVAAARDVLGTARIRIEALDVLRALVLEAGEPREVSVTWNEAERTVHIRSRQRFEGAESFVLHARGTVSIEAGTQPPAPTEPAGLEWIGREAVYAAAEAARMGYTGAFRAVVACGRAGDVTVAEITPTSADLGAFRDVFATDPVSFDAAFHGLMLGIERGPGLVAGELPVRVARLSLFEPERKAHRSVARMVRRTRGARVFDIDLLSASGSVVARAEGVVMRRVTFAAWRVEDRVVRVHEEGWGAAPLDLAAALGPVEAAAQDAHAAEREAIAGFALAAAARAVMEAAGPRFAPSGPARLPAGARTVWHALTESLLEADLLRQDGALLALTNPTALPPPGEALRDLARRAAAAPADLRLAAHMLGSLPGLLAQGAPTPEGAPLAEAMAAHSIFLAPALDALRLAVERLAQASPERQLRLGLLPCAVPGLLPRLLPLARERRVSLTVLTANPGVTEGALARLGARELVGLADPGEQGEGLALDLLLAIAAQPLAEGSPSSLDILRGLARADRPVLLASPAHHPAIDLLHAATPDWFRLSVRPEEPVGAWPFPEETDAVLQDAGFRPLVPPVLLGEGSRLLALVPDALAVPVAGPRLGAGQGLGLLGLRAAATERLKAWLPEAEVLTLPDAASLAAELAARAGRAGLPVAAMDLDLPRPASAREALAGRILRLRALAMAMAAEHVEARLYVLCEGEDAVAHATAAFGRVLMNEFPEVAVCILRMEPGCAPSVLDAALRRHLSEPLGEREVVLRAEGLSVPRAARLAPTLRAPQPARERTRLRAEPGGLDRLAWHVEPRRPPRPGEVEVEVAATGLNFRDIMLGLDVLDDEILGEGLTNGALGFEFAGRVRALGHEVSGLAPGDVVMGFASDAFASHVTLPAAQLFRAPAGMSPEAAAAIPVAFVTAWYALAETARLRAGETVLIHGAAGGVGLAALQVAKLLGARVVAAAGTAEKRELLRQLGADITVDSRSSNLEEEVRAATGGVDVALNSVAGEAMRATLRLLKPFGRFIELGKRDFLDNTRLGLRPFVRNLAYFGVDIDQLLRHAPHVAAEATQRVVAAFEAGALHPIPHLLFEGASAAEAFRLMQASGHVGKLLVRPAREGLAPPDGKPAFQPAPGAHVVLGGTGGFGLATALWLGERGARTVIVASRKGEIAPEAAPRVAALAAKGVRVIAERLDVTVTEEVIAAVARWRAEHGRVAGVVHSAMVLDDGMILGLTPERLHAVLAPKVDGMRALAAATEGMPLQYLVTYSSTTTLVGSPGQGAYVAANAYLEGAVQELRAQGVPALAICWGAISDVGVIARTQGLGERLRASTGVAGVPSREALEHLGTLLAAPRAAPAISSYSVLRWSPAAAKLATLRSPYFGQVFGPGVQGAGGAVEGALDLANLPREEAVRRLTEVVREEVARILRLTVEDVEPERPLIDVGLDSLMALELRLMLEKRTGLDIPMLALGGGRSVQELVSRMLAAHSVWAQESEGTG